MLTQIRPHQGSRTRKRRGTLPGTVAARQVVAFSGASGQHLVARGVQQNTNLQVLVPDPLGGRTCFLGQPAPKPSLEIHAPVRLRTIYSAFVYTPWRGRRNG